MVVVVAVKAACVSVLAPLPWLVLGLAECYIIMEFPPPARHRQLHQLQQLQSSRATDFPCIVTQRRGRASTRGSVTGREWPGPAQHRYPGHLSFSRPTLAHCLAACLAHCSAWPQHSSPHTFGFTMRPLRPDVEQRINYLCNRRFVLF